MSDLQMNRDHLIDRLSSCIPTAQTSLIMLLIKSIDEYVDSKISERLDLGTKVGES